MYHSSLWSLFLKQMIFYRNIPLIWGLRCSNMDISMYSKALNIVIKCCRLFSKRPNFINNNSLAGLNFHQSIKFYNNKSIVIHNGIDTDRFIFNSKLRKEFRTKFKISNEDKVLLCVGRYDPMKDHNTLINSFRKIRKEYSSIVLILAGEEPKIKSEEGIISWDYNKINEVYLGAILLFLHLHLEKVFLMLLQRYVE